jgi:protein-export membrane protein SecD
MIFKFKAFLVSSVILSVLLNASCKIINNLAPGPTDSLIYSADLTQKDPSKTDTQVMADIKSTIENRLHTYGISNPLVEIQESNHILVELKGVKDINQVINLIGQVGLLEFKEPQLDASGNVVHDANCNSVWISSIATGSDGTTQEALTGKYLKPNATVTMDSLGKPEVAFDFNTEGAKLFGEITQRLLNKPLGIFMDNKLISAPTVMAVSTDKGVINGVTLDEAKNLVVQLNSGSLDVPLTLISQTPNNP